MQTLNQIKPKSGWRIYVYVGEYRHTAILIAYTSFL